MSCTKCKKKERLDELWKESKQGIETKTISVVVIVVLFALYGVFELISKFI